MFRVKAFLIAICCCYFRSISFGSQNKNDSIPTLGLISLSDKYFPIVRNAVNLEIPNGSFEENTQHWPNDWSAPSAQNITRTIAALTDSYHRIPKPAEIAYAMNITLGEYEYIFSRIQSDLVASPWKDPGHDETRIKLISRDNGGGREGRYYLHLSADGPVLLRSPDFEVKQNKPHFMSLWVRSNVEIKTGPWFWFDAGLEEINMSLHGLPNTGGKWKRVGIYFRAPPDMHKAHWTISLQPSKGKYIDIDDVQLRTAGEAEFSSAYQQWRNQMPANPVPPDSNNGKYLCNSIAKLKGIQGLKGKPFLVWGVGSSWTHFQGDLETWRQKIMKEFPNAPEIIYKSRTGSGCPYDYARGWVHTMVLADKPDLIFCYTNGSMDALAKMLADIRQHSTADIIIPSLHFFANSDMDNDQEETAVVDTIRQLCIKYKAQFVDNRNLLRNWLKANNKGVSYLLFDAVHQTELGKLLINENIAAHFTVNPQKGYDEKSLEEEIPLSREYQKKSTGVKFTGDWTIDHDMVTSSSRGSSIQYTFKGNRVDLSGWKGPLGGAVRVLIDGIPADQQNAYYISYIDPALTNIAHTGSYPRSSRGNADTGPHGILLGKNLVPQQWVITMIDNDGDYTIKGSKTGFDGKGNNKRYFESTSGQIIVDPELWRFPQTNVKDDSWTFSTRPCAPAILSFKCENDTAGWYNATLTDQLVNKEHTLDLIVQADMPVSIRSLYIYTPMLPETKEAINP